MTHISMLKISPCQYWMENLLGIKQINFEKEKKIILTTKGFIWKKLKNFLEKKLFRVSAAKNWFCKWCLLSHHIWIGSKFKSVLFLKLNPNHHKKTVESQSNLDKFMLKSKKYANEFANCCYCKYSWVDWYE